MEMSTSVKCIFFCISYKFIDLGSSVSSTENDINTQLGKVWTAIDRLSVIWKSDLFDKIKCSFFQAVVISIWVHHVHTN